MTNLNVNKANQDKRPSPYSGQKMRALPWIKTVLQLSIYGYPVVLLGVLALLRISGDRWWFTTVLLYGPRWIYAIPMLVLVPIAILWRPRWLWPLGLSALIIVWPIMGLNVPWKGWSHAERSPTFRVLTFNLQRWSVSGEEFSMLLDEVDPDFAAVQECAPNRWNLPSKWHVKRAKTCLVVSRYPMSRCEISERKPDINGLYCVVETPAGPVGFACVDLLTPRRALATVLDSTTVFDLTQIDYAQKRIDQRWKESEDLNRWLSRFSEPKIIAGDFNLTVDSTIYRNSWSQYQNAFSQTEFGYGHTKRTKINMFNYTTRIDHILSTPHFLPTRCWVGQYLGSDHLPLIADVNLKRAWTPPATSND